MRTIELNSVASEGEYVYMYPVCLCVCVRVRMCACNAHSFSTELRGPSSSSELCYCPWLTFCHVAHLIKISKLLFGNSVSRGEVGVHVTWVVVGLDKDGR